jgi:hypothetical protein
MDSNGQHGRRNVATLWPAASSRSVVVVLRRGACIDTDTDQWRTAVRRAMRGSARTITCEVSRLGPADIGVVDRLAKVALEARRIGATVRLRAARPCLQGLVGLAGLDQVLPPRPGSAVQLERDAEPLEQLGVEEVVHVPDLPA